MNFRDLVDQARRAGLPATEPPRTVAWVAERCRVERSYLYRLMSGERVGPDHTVARLAKGLGVSRAKVRAALDKTLRQAG